MLNLQAVNHFYGNQHSLWNVDLVLRPGECIGVLGREGMGKTTLVNCIAGHLPVASGRMTWHDIGAPPQDLTPLSAQSRSAIGIGYVPQDKRIFSQLSVEENLHIALAAGKPGANASGGEIYEHFPELYALRQRKGASLSDDDQYQLALARALRDSVPPDPGQLEALQLALDEDARGLLATEGYFSPQLHRHHQDNTLTLRIEPGPRTEISAVQLALAGPGADGAEGAQRLALLLP